MTSPSNVNSPNATANHPANGTEDSTGVVAQKEVKFAEQANGAHAAGTATNAVATDLVKLNGSHATKATASADSKNLYRSPEHGVNNHSAFTETGAAPKSKSRSIAARGEGAMPKWRGTGFEENYADPPLSPEEYSEEQAVYASYLPFHERIQECIQRFRSRRRMNSEQTDIFSKYLLVGGIDALPRMFTGTGSRTHGKPNYDGASKSEIRCIEANDVIADPLQSRFYNPDEPEHWDVDFTGVAAGYITSTLIQYCAGKKELIDAGIDIICNFLRYVHMHNVAPEYTDDISRALATSLAAKVEIPLTSAAFKALPGDFNLSARALFMPDRREEIGHSATHAIVALQGRLEKAMDAERVFKATIAIWGHLFGDKEMARALEIDSVKIKATRIYDLELVSVIFPDESVRESYAGVRHKATGEQRVVEPAGLAQFRHIVIEDGFERPADEDKAEIAAREKEVFFLEESIVGTAENPGPLLPGMKVRATVCELDCGLKFFKDILEVKPSMYVFLPQELMLHYKEPVDNERPAPSVMNPDAEEKVMEEMIDEEIKAENAEEDGKAGK